jgi:predicted phage tail protein
MLDKWSLYRLAQYCDQMVDDGKGGQEPRFTCNVYLQSTEDAYTILSKLAGVFRAISYWDGNDKPISSISGPSSSRLFEPLAVLVWFYVFKSK